MKKWSVWLAFLGVCLTYDPAFAYASHFWSSGIAPAAVCVRIKSSEVRERCLNKVEDGVYFSQAASRICMELEKDVSKAYCIEQIAGRRYKMSELEDCWFVPRDGTETIAICLGHSGEPVSLDCKEVK